MITSLSDSTFLSPQVNMDNLSDFSLDLKGTKDFSLPYSGYALLGIS